MSTLCQVSELDLFSPNPIQLSVIDTHENVYSPLSSLDNASVIQFQIPGSSEYYIDLNNVYLRLKLQILKSDGSAYKEVKDSTKTPPEFTEKKAEQCGLINNNLHSLFKTLRVSLNGTVVNEIQNYHIKSYIDTLLNYSNDQQNTSLITQGFMKDTKDQFDKVNGDNSGLVSRKYRSDNSLIFELYGRLNADIFNQPKLLINGVNLDILLTLESLPFVLMGSSEKPTIIKFHEASLHVRHVKVHPQFALDTYKMLHSGKNAIYPFKRSEVKTYTVPKGLSSIELNHVFNGRQPTNFVMCMVENEALIGNMEKNPFNFAHFNCKSISFNLNGVPIQPSPLEHTFSSTGGYSRTYAEFLKAIGAYLTERISLVDMDEFRKGYFLVPVNLSPRQILDENLCEEISKEGSFGINLAFTSALPSSITIIVYAEYNETMNIDKNMSITL